MSKHADFVFTMILLMSKKSEFVADLNELEHMVMQL
jgi:hypothetical protein